MAIKGPLSGIRILDLTQAHSGPYGSQLLGDLGAEIIKIELPETGDLIRDASPKVNEMSYLFLTLNRNKKSITLDLQTASGKEAFYNLVKISDVVFDNFRAGVRERLGIDYKTLNKFNSKIITCSLTGFGPTGPYSKRAAFDDIIQGISGAISLCGEPEGKPLRPGIPIADISGGIFAAMGILVALYEREKTGRGRQVEINLLNCMLSLLHSNFELYFVTGKAPGPQGTWHTTTPLIGIFKTKDGYLVLGPCWPQILKAINKEGLINDIRFVTAEARFTNKDELNSIVEDALCKENTEHWLKIMQKLDIAAAPVNTIDRAAADPQVLHNKMIINMHHPAYGSIKAINCPIYIATQGKPEPPPILGQHTEDVLKELLGYSEEKIKKMEQEIIENKNKRGKDHRKRL